ncbi:hypothetical protein C922_05058 [Plasmodium inui San Antonio 1]|uniref:Uncharacterized protein n=1 Tax=Plasmodium inui San Antonio 1 TaxID=1237626 RepID=W6ZUW8_9APIC|nr:hypothetical protein C922_05058 [Plasmodium inui San Antonio 1]EUD64542.1 hypothetical protein C922_05058 [Plasmodium inui San Antonio 1]
MGKINLKQEKQFWEGTGGGGTGNNCSVGHSRYCIGSYGGEEEAYEGFIGKWKKGIGSATREMDWNRQTGRQSLLAREILGGQVDEYKWKGILSCVMYEALNGRSLKVMINQKQHILWDNRHWNRILSRGVNNYWADNSHGQAMLLGLACLIRALLGWDIDQMATRQATRALCGPVWDLVGIRLENPVTGEGSLSVKSQDQFLTLLKGETGGTDDQLTKLGFLSSIYYGLTSCCDTARHYDLTPLIRVSGYQMQQMGPCTIEGDSLQCGIHSKSGGSGSLNIWRTGIGTVLPEKSLDTSIGEGPKLKVDPSEEDEVKRIQRDSLQGSQLVQAWVAAQAQCQGGKRGGEDRCSRQVQEAVEQAKKKKDMPTGELERDRIKADKPPKPEQGARALRLPEQQGGETAQELNSQEHQDLKGPAAPNRVVAEGSIQKSEPEGKIQGRDLGDDVGDSREDDGNSQMKKVQTTASSSVGSGPIIGGIMGLILAVASVYGLYRIFRRRGRSRVEPPMQLSAGITRRVAYR